MSRFKRTIAAWGVSFVALALGAAPAAAQVIPDKYIVVFKADSSRPGLTTQGVSTQRLTSDLITEVGGRMERRFGAALDGFSAEMSAAAAKYIANHPAVAYVEQDQMAYPIATQSPVPAWGIDRIDQTTLPLDNSYEYTTGGNGVHVYIIDTGIRDSHDDFGGRVSGGTTYVSDGRGTDDCNGHGTHVAGTAAGTTYGVAKEASLHPVRVFGCSGGASYSTIISAVDWVTANHQSPAVVNMSLGGGVSTALNDAVANSIAAGVTYAVSAGNDNGNACNKSPASTPEALTVGSTESDDDRSSFSNFGTCVDLFAPGTSIRSAWYTGDSASATLSGTSMASPHVAGVAALYLGENPGASPSVVASAILGAATPGVVNNPGTGSPNLLLYSLLSPASTVVAEVGSVTRNQTGGGADWYSVSLANTYTNPVVVAHTLSFNGGHPTHIRVRNAGGGSFQWKMEEWAYLDGNHTTETVPYIVVESGTHVLQDGTIIEAGTTSVNQSFSTVNFSQSFGSAPVVLHGVMSNNEATPVVSRVQNVSTSSFQVKLREEEAENNTHANETVGWIAILPGNGVNNGNDFVAGRTGNSVTHSWSTISFAPAFSSAPIFLANMDTNDGNDTAGIRYRNLSGGSVEVFVEEETSADSETNHTTERVSYLAWEGASSILAQ